MVDGAWTSLADSDQHVSSSDDHGAHLDNDGYVDNVDKRVKREPTQVTRFRAKRPHAAVA
jgi:hypothetical protein